MIDICIVTNDSRLLIHIELFKDLNDLRLAVS